MPVKSVIGEATVRSQQAAVDAQRAEAESVGEREPEAPEVPEEALDDGVEPVEVVLEDTEGTEPPLESEAIDDEVAE